MAIGPRMSTPMTIRPMTILADAAHTLLAWFSPGYPVGAYSHSHGLEREIDAGRVRDADDLRRWLTLVLRQGAGRNDAILLACASHADGGTLDDLSELARALCGSAERLRETADQGRAFAAVTAAAYGSDPAPRPYPVAVGAAAGALCLPLSDTLRHYLHGFAANLISAAVRFMPLGQTEGQLVLRSLFAVIDAVAAEAETADLESLGSAVPGADLAAMEHETMQVRIFRS